MHLCRVFKVQVRGGNFGLQKQQSAGCLREKRHLSSHGGGARLLGSEVGVLLVLSLEATVTNLGGGIDELEVGLLEGSAGGDNAEGLSDGDGALAGSHDGALEHDEVVLDGTVVGEATHGGDDLLGDIVGGGGVGGVRAGAEAVDLLVDHGTVVVTHLTSSGNLELDTGRVPRANASDLADTSVGLSGQDGNTPSLDDTLDTVTLVDSDDVAHVVLSEDGVDGDGLLEEAGGEGDLLGDVATVDLDLHDVGALLADLGLGDLGVGDDADDLASLRDLLELGLHLVSLVLLSVLGVGELLALVPVSVETALELVGQVTGPDGVESAEATRGLDVANDTNNDHGGAVDDGDGLDNVLLVELGAGSLDLADDVSHASLVAHEGGQVGLLGLVIGGESLDAALSSAAALLGQETQGAVTGVLKLAVGHAACCFTTQKIFMIFLTRYPLRFCLQEFPIQTHIDRSI